jgi:hypothetical protein
MSALSPNTLPGLFGRFLIGALLACPWAASATSLVSRPWRLSVFDADFVGVVECETAGLRVADDRVLEAWKGGEVGNVVRMAVGVETWEPGIPSAERGEPFLVLAKYSNGTQRSDCHSSDPGCSEPYWWRDIPSSFAISWAGGRTPVDLGEDKLLFRLPGMRVSALSTYRDSVRAFLALDPEDQEARVLNDGYPARQLLPYPETRLGLDSRDSGPRPHEAHALRFIEIVLDSLASKPRAWNRKADETARRLGFCGGDRSLAYLRSQE